VGLFRWKLLYLIERGDLPGPSVIVPGRRLFTDEDVESIRAALAKRPDLFRRRKSSTTSSGSE
jgi:hypothetical protein